MKNLIFLVSLISLNASALEIPHGQSSGRVFSCEVTGEEKVYDDIFVMQIGVGGVNSLWHKRLSEDINAELQVVKGCENAVYSDNQRKDMISLECAYGGQEGLFDINPISGWGEIYFYEDTLGYGERALIQVQCVAVN